MAIRPIFIPIKNGNIGVAERMIEFHWHPGMATIQKQKSISALHQSANNDGISPILEISSKSQESLGVNLSAFNLFLKTQKQHKLISVESAFQGSKIFKNGGPYNDIYDLPPQKAKKDERVRSSGDIIGFEFFGLKFSNFPRTLFYDWLYINTLIQNCTLAEQLSHYAAFSDIEFNPERSINCQAHSAALYLSILFSGHLDSALKSPEHFITITKEFYSTQHRNYVFQNQIF